MLLERQYSVIDQFIMGLDQAVVATIGDAAGAGRPYPAENKADEFLSVRERRHVAGLMRVDHAGEVAAQALYQGQGMTARDSGVRTSMKQAAEEEIDHLAWCSRRLRELHSRSSRLDPFWYVGSLGIGALAGMIGDKWSLGFVLETERQVVRHLDSHLLQLPQKDERSRAILEQMRDDEGHHATIALESGAVELPELVKKFMTLCSKVLTTTAYWI